MAVSDGEGMTEAEFVVSIERRVHEMRECGRVQNIHHGPLVSSVKLKGSWRTVDSPAEVRFDPNYSDRDAPESAKPLDKRVWTTTAGGKRVIESHFRANNQAVNEHFAAMEDKE
jgi:hypothetical protein